MSIDQTQNYVPRRRRPAHPRERAPTCGSTAGGKPGRAVVVCDRKKVIGDVAQYPSYADAKRAADPIRIEVNAAHDRIGKVTVRDAWEHFLANEMHNPEVDRSPTTIEVYQDNFRLHILPRWGETFLADVKPVQVESWLRGLTLARSTKSKLRNNLSVLFSHAIRHEMYDRINPISSVRQSSKRRENSCHGNARRDGRDCLRPGVTGTQTHGLHRRGYRPAPLGDLWALVEGR